MNREFLPEAVAGITVGLLLAVLAVYRTTKAPSSGVVSRAAMISVLLYSIIASQVLVQDGLTLVGLLLLLAMLCVPVAGMLAAARIAPAMRRGEVVDRSARLVRIVVSTGLAAAMLIAAAQTLAMLSLVDPRTVVVVLAVVTALLVAVDGMRASGRIGSLAVWLLVVPILLSLALAFLLGNVGQAVSPIIRTNGIAISTVVCLVVAFAVLGAVDPALATSYREAGWSPVRVLGGVFAVVIVIVFGLLMFFGGAIVSPTLVFFVIPANLNAVPGPAAVSLAVLTLLFAAVVANALGGLRSAAIGRVSTFAAQAQLPPADIQPPGSEDPAPRPETGTAGAGLVAVGAGIAAIVALLNPGMEWVVIATSVVAAALAAATTERGVLVGSVGSVLGIVVLTLTDTMTYGWWVALVIVAVVAVGRLASGTLTQAEQPSAEADALV